MKPKVPTIDTGTAALGISAARALPRKTNTTRITRPTAIISVASVSRSEARIVVERSDASITSTSAGSAGFSCSICLRTLSTVLMILAPG
jgi:hypothetical protein